jgi:hypothetical protein
MLPNARCSGRRLRAAAERVILGTLVQRGTVLVGSIAKHSPDMARAFVDKILGSSAAWPSRLIAYRLDSDSQADWKCEVGRWLLHAESEGFLQGILARVGRARQPLPTAALSDGKADPNDPAHLVLHHELAAAEVAYYLSANGWSFLSVPDPSPAFDVDLRMRAPTGETADIQIKASDRPGRIEGYHRVDGEVDEHVTSALEKAIRQISNAPGPIRMVITCPQRTWPMSRESGPVAAKMLGSTIGNRGGGVTLEPTRRGLFIGPHGSRVHATAILDFYRPVDGERYGCTVFLNPWVQGSTRLSPEAFPVAAVCELAADTFRWHGDPGRCHVVPAGTRYLRSVGGA